MVKHWQDSDIDQYEKDSNEESYRKTKKRIKCIFDTYKKRLFCQNCYNGNFTKDCKLLLSFVSNL
jgi:hypothetical protein